MKTLLRVLGFLKPFWRYTAGAYLSLLAITGLNLVMPLILAWAVNNGITNGHVSTIEKAAALLVGLAVFRGIFTFFQGYLSEVASQGVAYDLRSKVYEHLQQLSFSYHDQAQTGQLMARATSDVEVIRQFTGRGFISLANIAVMVVAVGAVLFTMNWHLALASCVAFPFIFLTANRFNKTFRPLSQQIQQELAVLTTILQENLAGVRIVRAFAREPEQAAAFTKQNDYLLDKSLDAVKAQRSALPLMDLISNMTTVVVLWYGGMLVIQHSLNLGDLVAFNIYLASLVLPIRRLGFLVAMLSRAIASGDRVFEILDAKSEVTDAPGAVDLPPIEGRVTFRNVTFRYSGLETVLRDVSFAAEPGQMIALLGGTGSGKSTIINLIPRFYDVTSGAVLVDDMDVRKVRIESLRRQIGIVLQETVLFSGTIRENVSYGRPDADLDSIVEAAKAARAHDFIMSFPDGYDTLVGERGVTLSGGQKQRVAIARALLLDPRILILDDSTSSVDMETEYLIQQALDVLMKGRTTFVIAQRISTVRKADVILVLDKGRIVARGTHEQLIEESGLYAELYDLQLKAEREAAAAGERAGRAPDGRAPDGRARAVEPALVKEVRR